jgi:hypothetical protein
MRTRLLSIVGGMAILAAGQALAQEVGSGVEDDGAYRVLPGPHRPRPHGFDLEVVVGGRPLLQNFWGGERHVEVTVGSEYELRLTNPLPARVAVAVSVDGLNVVDGRHASARDASKWVVHPRGTLTITGWQVGSERARRFYFTTERDSYANRIGRPGEFGVIVAAFYRERSSGGEIIQPRAAASVREEARGAPERTLDSTAALGAVRDRDAGAWRERMPRRPARDRAATGMGGSLGSPVRVVDMELDPDPVAVVTIRYDFRRPRPWPEPLPRFAPERGGATRRDDARFAPEP